MAGLEESAYPLFGRIESLLKTFGPPDGDFSWFVLHHFSRPIPAWPDLKDWIKKCCAEVAGITNLPAGSHLEARLNDNFDLVFLRSSEKHERLFLTGGCSDYDSGGFILAEMEKNIRHCIDEKSSKVSAYRHRYREWWLALVDYIGYGLSIEDQNQFSQSVRIQHGWDKIIVVSPLDPLKYFEI